MRKKIALLKQELTGFSETPYLDAVFYCTDSERTVSEEEFIRRRKSGEPVSKIMGHIGFWNLDFKVSNDVLDPRPDSEIIIETILKLFPDTAKQLDIMDIGTGSGCLLITLLSLYKNATGLGVDISEKALKIATENAKNYPAKFLQADLFNPTAFSNCCPVDILVSNPPYIPTDDISALDSVRFDPLLALDGGKDGLNAYRALSKLSCLVKPNGYIILEIGINQEKQVISIFNQWKWIKTEKDYGGIPRVLIFQKKQ